MGSKDTVQFVFGSFGGIALLVGLVLALAAFAAWRLLQAVRDVDGHGTSAKGMAVRAGLTGSAVSYAALAVFAGTLAIGVGSSGGGAKEALAKAFEAGWGEALTWLACALLVAVGIAHLFKGGTAGFEKFLSVPAESRNWLIPVCQFGLIARGLTFLLLAYLIATGVASLEDNQTPGLATALEAMSGWRFGWAFLAATGLGLIAFGIYAFAEARYRRIEVR
ncbi:DUF1206 domain-containing protein [Aureimonas leprariae]|uniref:DUF1206 domain-containing protein n=2 Tax=Plantimonas leprariae TaxID=2615207 RepID=A0A7V7U0F8_9HYPH|nr:DUF1206 domain-containing protein [Aureimonas leprariae]